MELLEQQINVVQRVGPQRMAAQLGYLPGIEVGEDVLDLLLHLGL